MNKQELIKRLKNPLFLVALASLVYQVLQNFGIKIDQTQYKSVLDLASYIILGAGIYSTFPNNTINNTAEGDINNVKNK